MPSERWKCCHLIVTTSLLLICHFLRIADGAEGMQHPISMGADGWKPILGNNRPSTNNYQDEIKYYQNPILKETVKAEPLPSTTPSTISSSPPKSEHKALKTIAINVLHPGYTRGKVPPHSKNTHQYYVLPNHGSHGPHIPLNAVVHRNQNHHKKIPSKNHGHNGGKRMKKPGFGQLMTAHSTRNEVYAPAPGSYSFFSQGKNVKTRESAGLSNEGQKIFTVKHPHMEYSSHFPPNSIYQQGNQPIQHIIFQKQQVNEIIPAYQVDNLQNLSPPPLFKSNQGQHLTINPEIRTPDDKVVFGHNPLGPNDLILQLPPYDLNLFGYKQQPQQNSVNVQVTRENMQQIQTYPSQNIIQVEGEFGHINHEVRRPVTEYPKKPTYEVTEGKWEENTSSSDQIHTNVELDVPPFLPTPYRPDKAVPTSPTQNEVSTIFGQLSNAVKKHPESYTHNPLFFDVKEVSTHYPILGRPGYLPTAEPTEESPSNENTERTTEWEQQTTEEPSRIHHRRRRPTLPRTTTPAEVLTEPITENFETTTHLAEVETERPYRQRRPVRPRPSSSEEIYRYRQRDRHRKRPQHSNSSYRKRVRPNRFDSGEYTTNRPTEESREEATEVLPIIQYFTTEKYRDQEEEVIDSLEVKTDKPKSRRRPYLRGKPEKVNEETDEESSTQKETDQNSYVSSYESASQEEDTHVQNHESSRVPEEENEIKTNTEIIPTTEEPITLTTIGVPENEVEDTSPSLHEEVLVEDFQKVTTTPEPEPTTTTTTPTPTKSNRRRPIKYNASSRPRFSVKDYRQRLNQYTSTSTTSTEVPKVVSDTNVRLRFPTRLRRPSTTTSTTTQVYEETTRSKFIPKEPRYSSSQVTNEVITERNIKAVNTRLRPFGRMKTTTETPASTAKISIKPNLFSNRRRPPLTSLKSRIYNVQKSNESDDKTEKTNELDGQNETTTVNVENYRDATTEYRKEEEDVTTSGDILKNDAFEYSQRVSDLTSSMKDEYESFKAVPSNSRRVPNHYTISTEDPVLPLEAFFSNINDRVK